MRGRDAMICIYTGPFARAEFVRSKLRARGIEAYFPHEVRQGSREQDQRISRARPGQRLVLVSADASKRHRKEILEVFRLVSREETPEVIPAAAPEGRANEVSTASWVASFEERPP